MYRKIPRCDAEDDGKKSPNVRSRVLDSTVGFGRPLQRARKSRRCLVRHGVDATSTLVDHAVIVRVRRVCLALVGGYVGGSWALGHGVQRAMDVDVGGRCWCADLKGVSFYIQKL